MAGMERRMLKLKVEATTAPVSIEQTTEHLWSALAERVHALDLPLDPRDATIDNKPNDLDNTTRITITWRKMLGDDVVIEGTGDDRYDGSRMAVNRITNSGRLRFAKQPKPVMAWTAADPYVMGPAIQTVEVGHRGRYRLDTGVALEVWEP